MSNPFLSQFMEMRKNLVASGPALPHLPETKEKKKKEGTKKIQSTATKPGFHTIIEEKPGKKPVIEYLQQRANELTTQKMA